MNQPGNEELRILMLEDSATDAQLLERELQRRGVVFRSLRVETKKAFREALHEFDPGVVLSDFEIPGFSGVEGLEIAREMRPDVPYIYVSGTIGEEHAIELLKRGATDYILKQNLSRLAPSLKRALDEAQMRREHRRDHEQLVKLSRAVEYNPASIIITDAEGIIEYVNPKCITVSGYSAEELIGQNPRILKSDETPPAVYEELWETITAGGEWRGELHNRRKNGEPYWEFASISGIRDQSGKVTNFVAVKEDITERRRAQNNLLRAQRMESIGTLASGVAHDLNNILAPIMMAMPLLDRDMNPAAFDRIVSTVVQSAERGAQIVKQVLAFGRGLEGVRRTLRIGPLLAEIVKIMEGTFPKDIRISSSAPPELWNILGDPTQIHQVLLNLCVNARDAMPGGGNLSLAASNIDIDAAYASMIPDGKPGPHVVIEIRDSGTGIPPEIRERIFDPFFTTKEVGKGTGLGLSTTLGIVKSHNGFLSLESQPGKGTTFKVFLPVDSQAAAIPESAPAGKPPRGNGELILFVDDETSIRSVAGAVLEANGYHVLLAGESAEALGLFAQRSGDIAVVITDIVMPFMDGVSLTRAFKKMRPGIPVIAITGHADHSRLEELKKLGVGAFLRKPFETAAILHAIHDVLEKSARDSAQSEALL